jgi:hypothetical protein
MEYILGNTLLALLEYPGATLLGVNKMLSDKEYRKKVVDNISDPAVKSFWVDEFAKYTEKFAAEATPAIQNKIGQFTNNPLIRNIIGQPDSSFDLRKMMDERKIIIVNLSKGRVGESNANLLGAMFITKIYLAAMSRADRDEKQMKNLPNFYLYVDEFQSFANESFADILSEARKYKLNLTIAHQYVEQMSEEVRAAVFGNVGTMIVFRVGSFDAEQFEKEFSPQFTAEDIVNLGQYQIYLRLMIDGVGSQPFSARNLPPIPPPPISFKQQAIEASRAAFGQLRAKVEEGIRKQVLGDDKTPSVAAPIKSAAPAPSYQQRPAAPSLPHAPAPRPQPSHLQPAGYPKPAAQGPRTAPSGQSTPRPPKDRPAPPADDTEGFLSLKDLKVAPKAAPQKPERKGVTEESRSDLRSALANLAGIKPQGEAPKLQQPKAQAPQAKPEQQPEPKPGPKATPPKGEAKEVPEDVLKRLLDVEN